MNRELVKAQAELIRLQDIKKLLDKKIEDQQKIVDELSGKAEDVASGAQEHQD